MWVQVAFVILRWARPGEVIVMIPLALLGCGLLGFLAGLFTFKLKSRWCPHCGAWTSEARPVHRQTAAH